MVLSQGVVASKVKFSQKSSSPELLGSDAWNFVCSIALRSVNLVCSKSGPSLPKWIFLKGTWV